MRIYYFFIGFMLCGAPLALAEDADPASELAIADTVVVTSTGLPRRLQATAASVSVIEQEALQFARQHLALDEALTRVPGLVFQNRYNTAQNLRIAARGFGARSPFGVRGLRLVVDGFPETLPDGQAQVDMIDLFSAERVEVLRGAASALYGNAAGGVIAIDTADGRGRDHSSATVAVGSHGFQRLSAMLGGGQAGWSGLLSVSTLDYDGYRQQSATRKHLANARGAWDWDGARRLSLAATWLDQPYGQDPGALTLAQVTADRRQASAQAISLDSGQSVTQGRLGLRWSDEASLPGRLQLQGFVSERDFEQQLPSSLFPSLIAFDRSHRGWRLQYDDVMHKAALRWQLGLESAHQRDQRRRFRVNAQAQPIAQTQDELQAARAEAVFGQIDLDWLWLGLRHDRTQLRIVDRFAAGEGSGQRRFNETSMMGGLRFAPRPDQQWHLSVGSAFETPTFTEIKDAAGGVGFSRDIDPQRARNLELGWRWDRPDWRLVVTAFDVRTRDEIVVLRAVDGLDEFSNAGITQRQGVELSAQRDWASGVAWVSAWTLADYRFVRFGAGDQSFDGQRMPGLPKHQWFNELSWTDGRTLRWAIDGLLMGAMMADNANTERVAASVVLNARVSRQWCGQGQCVELFAGLNNLTDRDYFSNVRINVANRAYYEPAPGRHGYVGLRWQWQ